MRFKSLLNAAAEVTFEAIVTATLTEYSTVAVAGIVSTIVLANGNL